MIEATIIAALTPLQTYIDTLTMRVEAYESKQGGSSKISALKVEVAELRKDVVHLKSTDFNTLIGDVDDLDAPETSKMPSATIGDIPKNETQQMMSQMQRQMRSK
ncbi:hypothetical protein H5410_031042 [Solanum commersonii]|uniref:Polyprotein protein n=1 Tax=Solanum commersonii TaxID=4109 RepID=A0A9J5YJ38_SOLCO|nr:hypothetical protein H5410_031042 [Solanum commersonii]